MRHNEHCEWQILIHFVGFELLLYANLIDGNANEIVTLNSIRKRAIIKHFFFIYFLNNSFFEKNSLVKIHKGPGLIGNLLGVFLRFREEPIAFVGDISKMYLQIELPEEDKHVYR